MIQETTFNWTKSTKNEENIATKKCRLKTTSLAKSINRSSQFHRLQFWLTSTVLVVTNGNLQIIVNCS